MFPNNHEASGLCRLKCDGLKQRQIRSYPSALIKAKKAQSLLLNQALRLGCAAFSALDCALVFSSSASTSG